MRLQNVGQQQRYDSLWRADGAILTGGSPQLVLGRSMARSHLLLQNTSSGPLWFEIGTGAATATLTNGAVSSIAVNNAGFNFTHPPLVRFYGGGNAFGNSSYTGLAQPGGPPPNSVASSKVTIEPLGQEPKAVAVLSGAYPATISSITVLRGGSGFVIAPYVAILNSDLDPNGAAAPAAGVGILLQAGGPPLIYNGSVCPTDPVAVWGATTGQTYACRWLD